MIMKSKHTNRLRRAGADLYAWFWWHTELWLSPEARRPYTFIMRDIYHNAPLLVLMAVGGVFYCLGRWWLPVSARTFLVGFLALLVGTLLGHLFWGAHYTPGEQESPEYNPGAQNAHDP